MFKHRFFFVLIQFRFCFDSIANIAYKTLKKLANVSETKAWNFSRELNFELVSVLVPNQMSLFADFSSIEVKNCVGWHAHLL